MKSIKFRESFCVLVCLVFVLGVSVTCGARLPQDQFGTCWVQTHPFQICSCDELIATDFYTDVFNLMDLYTTDEMCFNQYDSGWAAYYGPTIQYELGCNSSSVSNGSVVQSEENDIAAYSTPGYSGIWQLGEDLTADADFNAIGVVATYLNGVTPNAPTLYDEGYDPTDPTATVDYCLTNSHPDIFMGDDYPFYQSGDPSQYPEDPNWYRRAMVYRTCCQSYGVPYYAFLAAFAAPSTSRFRLPSESEIRVEAYTCLTMGFKGIAWFNFDSSDPTCDDWLVNQTTRAQEDDFPYVQSVDAEIHNLGPYLRFLNSTGVGYVPDQAIRPGRLNQLEQWHGR